MVLVHPQERSYVGVPRAFAVLCNTCVRIGGVGLVGYEEGKSNILTKRYNDSVTSFDRIEIDFAKMESLALPSRRWLGPSAVPCVAVRPVGWRWAIGQDGMTAAMTEPMIRLPPENPRTM